MRHARRLHILVQFFLGFVIASVLIIGLLAMRLAEHPLPVAWAARAAAQAMSAQDRVVHVGAAELAWEGLHGGIDRPIDLVLRDVTIDDRDGLRLLTVPRAAVSLSLIDALQGRFAPRALALDHVSARLSLSAGTDATPEDWRPRLDRVLTGLREPQEAADTSAKAIWSRLQRVLVSNATLDLHNAQDLAVGRLADMGLDLRRSPGGGARLTSQGRIEIGEARTPIAIRATIPVGSEDISVGLSVDPIQPFLLAQITPELEPLDLIRLPVSLTGTAHIAPGIALRNAQMDITLGRGTLLLADGALPVRMARGHVEVSPDAATLDLQQLVLQVLDSAVPTHVTAHVQAHRTTLPPGGPMPAGPGVAAEVTADVDQVALDDLPAIWPLGIGGPGTRPWMVANAHGGKLSRGHVSLSLTAPEDFSDAVLNRLEGGIDGNDVTVIWLPGVPPLEHGSGHLTLTGPDTMEGDFTSGNQSGTALKLKRGHLKMIGLSAHDQFLSLDATMEGPMADAVAVLRQQRIRMLERGHMVVRDPSGTVTGRLVVDLPLRTDLDLDMVNIRSTGTVTDAHAGGLAGGRDVNHATVEFDVSNTGLKVGGRAEVEGIAQTVTAKMDFRNGPAGQVTLRVDSTATLTADNLAKFGLAHGGGLSGATKGQLVYQEHRGGAAEIGITSDLVGLGIADPRLPWRKPADSVLRIDVHGDLRGGKFLGFDRLNADGLDATLRANASFVPDGEMRLKVDTLKLGTTTDVTATLRLPPGEAPMQIDLRGASADFSALLQHRATGKSKRGPAYTLSAHLGQAVMANQRHWQDVSIEMANDGLITTRAMVEAKSGTNRIGLRIAPVTGGRDLVADADDAGALLGALDLSQRLESGTLSASGHYDDTDPRHTLRGTANIEAFRVRNAPAIARLLQAMSLYGLLEVAQGPGLGFTRAVAPFAMNDDTLTLENMRAYSASLGFTAKGNVDLDTHVADIEGTVIPAYFFNSLLGRLPLIGGLFSPEKDGGLLAVNYSIRGSLEDPRVGVNPLSALTPGVLRGFFDLFDAPTPPRPETSPPTQN